MDEADDLARAGEFDRRMTERMSTDVVPFAGGVAYLDRDFPRRFTANFLRVDDAGTAPVEHWIREADRIMGGSGLPAPHGRCSTNLRSPSGWRSGSRSTAMCSIEAC